MLNISHHFKLLFLKNPLAPAGMAQLVGAAKCARKDLGLIPSQGICPGCGLDPLLGHMWEEAGNRSMFPSHLNVSFSRF